MSQLLKQWRLAALTALTVVTVLGAASEAFAQGQNGESSKYTLEMVGGSGLRTRNDRVEARNGGNLLEVWRGADNNIVWMSLNNGNAFQIAAGSATNVAPAVVAWGPSDFLVFHTGTDGRIYFAPVSFDGSTPFSWSVVPAQTTQMPVSVAQMGFGSHNVYMVYRGFGNDTRVWGTWFDFFGGGWSQADNINGGHANSAPTISLAPHIPVSAENPTPFADRLMVTAVGTDNNIWSTGQNVGAGFWADWTPILNQPTGLNARHNLFNNRPVAPGAQVQTAVNNNTNGTQTLVMGILDDAHDPEFATFNFTTGAFGMPELAESSNWTVDTSGFQANETPTLTQVANSTYSLITGLNNEAYWKPVFHK
ncbi:MAG TPA: hypothetical protein VFK06_24170 [Candidatus Angelobacter sp.]|nr:hypothetical protein [Candidatus Angelobacter sp.]